MKRLSGLLLVLLAVAGADAPAAAQDEVMVSVASQRMQAHAGDQFAVAVMLDMAGGWHVWPTRAKGEVPEGMDESFVYWTRVGPAGEGQPDWEFEAAQPGNVEVEGLLLAFGDAQWPDAHRVMAAGATDVLAYSNRVVVYVPVVVEADAEPGVRELTLGVHYQACDEQQCIAPEMKTATVRIDVVGANTVVSGDGEGALFAPFDPTVFGRLGKGGDAAPVTRETAAFDFLGWSFSLQTNQYAVIFLIAAVAGFLLNLTPCVLPVIPLKVISLQKQAGNPAKLTLYGTVYCLGIVAMFAVFGVLIAFARQQWGELFGHAWFAAGMGALVFVLGLGMLGLFNFRLPNAVYMVNPAGDTVQGNFLMGGLTAILSTPCTGPFLGAALAWSATQPAWIGFTTLLVMGVGMAFPYALLIAFPKLMDRMPKAGPGGELLKQVMGMLLIAVSLYLFSNLVHGRWVWWVIGGVAGAGFAWAVIGGLRVLRTNRSKAITTVVAVLGIAASLGIANAMSRPSGIDWREFHAGDEALAATIDGAMKEGKVVIVKFTAQWCVNCHVIERQVYNDPASRATINQPDVVAVKVDLTSRGYDEGWSLLQQYSGGSGIPFSIFFGPGLEEPVSFRSFFKVSDLKSAIERARK